MRSGPTTLTVDVGRYSKEKMHATAKIDLEADGLGVGIVRCSSSTIQRLSFLAFFWQNSQRLQEDDDKKDMEQKK